MDKQTGTLFSADCKGVNLHMHKMGPKQFCSKMLESSDSMYSIFMLEKYIISQFYIILNEFTRNCEFCSNLVRVFGDPLLEQNLVSCEQLEAIYATRE